MQNAASIQVQAGRRASFVCPPVTPDQIAGARIWGTDVYPADSPICIAAVHAGVLEAGQAGIATVAITAGADNFAGSTRNGVTTQSYGRYAMAFAFDRSAPGQIDWATTGVGIPATFTASVLVSCPGGGAASFPVWGADVYTDDSSICTAAVHAGLITRVAGGPFFVTPAPGQGSYASSDRNGVKSAAWSEYSASFRVARSSAPLVATQATGVTIPGAPAPVVGTIAPAPPPLVPPPGSQFGASSAGTPALADRTIATGGPSLASCTRVANLKVVATSPKSVRATWDPVSDACKAVVRDAGRRLTSPGRGVRGFFGSGAF